MSYYKDLNRAYNWIEQRVTAAKEKDFEIDAQSLAYEATKKFPVGEKKLLQRMKKMVEYDKAPINNLN